MTTDAWGIDDQYYDALGTLRVTSPRTRAAIHQAMGVDPAKPAGQGSGVVVLRSGEAFRPPATGVVQLESGERWPIDADRPADLPSGYHDFFAAGAPSDEPPLRVIVSPGRCHLPADLRLWGWATQLYSTRSRASWGIGDLADLACLGSWARRLGAGMLMVNPLGAIAPRLPQEASPYYPSSRRFFNPLYVSIEQVAWYKPLASELAPLAALARALDSSPLIDRDAVYRLKLAALEKLWRAFAGHEQFERFVGERGEPLAQFATYCTLTEKLGANWHDWDVAYRDPGSPAVHRWAARNEDRRRFFQWIQWQLDVQLSTAAERLMLVGDLPIGASPDGFDSWAWQGCLGQQVAMGAPPDLFNTQGQNWGLPPLVPHKLKQARYEPFIEIVRAALRHTGGLRIDHVIGLFRSFWIPFGFAASEGAYVRYPVDDLLAILALESQRAGAVVIGEDLGTVEPGVREKLAAHDILSYALLYFERGQPAGYPQKSLASVSTHDLPTLAGLFSGSDLAEQQRLSLAPSSAEERSLREHLQTLAGLRPDASIDEVILKVHAALAPARSMLVAASLEDALGVVERPNIPNTTGEQRPNWSRALPVPLDDFDKQPRIAELAQVLSSHGPPTADR